uniref:Alkylated DNA repair protein AlkB homologue 8 N-terminal domain-containing protein n=1 Tax=Knipowitschia caucasica TaxID=637954 RepID=A0AAV2LXC8_KNICA
MGNEASMEGGGQPGDAAMMGSAMPAASAGGAQGMMGQHGKPLNGSAAGGGMAQMGGPGMGMASHDSVKLIKFADDTTLIGLISNNDESAYRREVVRLVSWCSGNNLELNAQKTVEMIVDFRKSTVPPPPPSVMDSPITSVESFRFLGTTITQDLKWEPTISSLIKKAQQRMYFLRQLRKAKLPAQMLVQFYTAIIESILTSSITVWFAGATVRDKQRLQRIVRSAEEVIGRSLPSLQDLAAAIHNASLGLDAVGDRDVFLHISPSEVDVSNEPMNILVWCGCGAGCARADKAEGQVCTTNRTRVSQSVGYGPVEEEVEVVACWNLCMQQF